MSRPVYIWVESPSTSEKLMPSVVATKFGDGYEQRAPNGLNPVAQVWSVNHDAIDLAIANEIRAFIKDGMGIATFEWTPPAQTVPLIFKCTSFTCTLSAQVNERNISMTFEQVFEP